MLVGPSQLYAPENVNKWIEGERSQTAEWNFPSDGSQSLLLPEALLGPWAGPGWSFLSP